MTNELNNKKIILDNDKTNENVKVLGVGKAGIKIIESLSRIQNFKWLEMAAVDTDKETISTSTLKNNFLVGEEWTKGQGCGGNLIKGERALAHKSNSPVKNFIKNSSLLIITAGFGRGTGTGGAPVIARFAKEKNIPVIILATLPFTFEGHTKSEIADRQINTLIKTTNTVIPIPNDLLYTQLPSTASFEEAFNLSNIHIAKAILGISELLQFENMLPVDLCALHNVLCKQKTECSVGIGICESENNITRTRSALKDLFESPLLGGRQRIKQSDSIVISITGGTDLTIGEVKHSLETLTSIAGKSVEIIAGANTDPSFKNKIQITVVSIKSDKTLETALSKAPPIHIAKQASKTAIIKDVKKLKEEAVQLELPFKTQSRGIFTNSTPTIYKGEDLDIPTFQRKDIHLDKGK